MIARLRRRVEYVDELLARHSLKGDALRYIAF
jgi:hypothetical protein